MSEPVTQHRAQFLRIISNAPPRIHGGAVLVCDVDVVCVCTKRWQWTCGWQMRNSRTTLRHTRQVLRGKPALFLLLPLSFSFPPLIRVLCWLSVVLFSPIIGEFNREKTLLLHSTRALSVSATKYKVSLFCSAGREWTREEGEPCNAFCVHIISHLYTRWFVRETFPQKPLQFADSSPSLHATVYRGDCISRCNTRERERERTGRLSERFSRTQERLPVENEANPCLYAVLHAVLIRVPNWPPRKLPFDECVILTR